MDPRIKIERRHGKTCRSVIYRIDGLAVVHLTQRLTSAGGNSPLPPKIGWVSTAQPQDLSYTLAFTECLHLAISVSESWAAETPVSLEPIPLCQPEARPDQSGRNALLF